MPNLTFSQALTANQLGYNPLDGWQFDRVPQEYINGAVCQLLVRCTDANARITVYTGSQTIQERSPVQGGGTASVTPSVLNTTPTVWIASPGDKLKLAIDEVAGGTPTIDGVITIEPR